MVSTLDPATLNTAEEHLLHRREDDNDRDKGDHRTGRDLAWIGGHRRTEVLHADCQRVLVWIIENNQWPQKVVSGPDEREHRDHGGHAPDVGPYDVANLRPRVRAVNGCRI